MITLEKLQNELDEWEWEDPIHLEVIHFADLRYEYQFDVACIVDGKRLTTFYFALPHADYGTPDKAARYVNNKALVRLRLHRTKEPRRKK